MGGTERVARIGIALLVQDGDDVDTLLRNADAAVNAAQEKGRNTYQFYSQSMNVALAVVFVSILFLDDFVERLFREFSLTLVAAMSVSVVVALSLVPMLCARLFVDDAQHASRWQRGSNALFERVREAYLRTLQACLRRLRWPLLAFVAVIALNAWLFQQVPKGVVPKQDTAQLRGFARGDDGLSFQAMQPKIDAYRTLLLSDPAIEDIIGYIGGSNGVNNAFIMIKMKPLAERKVSSQELIDPLRGALARLMSLIIKNTRNQVTNIGFVINDQNIGTHALSPCFVAWFRDGSFSLNFIPSTGNHIRTRAPRLPSTRSSNSIPPP